MSQPFDVWAKDEIARLRAEADALERALSRYTNQPTQTAVGNGGFNTSAAATPRAPAQYRASKYGPVMEVWRKAGDNGLTLDELDRIATEANVGANRNSLRSMVWNLKKTGRVIERPTSCGKPS